MNTYQGPKKENWKGRASDEPEYWHQSVQLIDLIKETEIHADVAFLGYQCEEGVKRNQGRLGAKNGPDAIRQFLGKLPAHRDDLKMADCGDLVFNEQVELKTFQLQFAGHINRMLRNKTFPIALGGGHDISYANFCGIHEALYENGKQFGIVNFDAHFDLRKESQSTSGTPFRQILQQFGGRTQYLALGIQQSANTKELFEVAAATNTRYLTHEACLKNPEESQQLVNQLSSQVDYLYVTVDMDAFSSANSPGVSAPSPFGLSPDYVATTLRHLLQTKKVVAIDFAETNPTYDLDHATARLASKLIWEVVQHI